MARRIMVMDAYTGTQAYTNDAVLWEFIEQDLAVSGTVQTKLDEIFGAVPLNNTDSGASTAYTDGVITDGEVTVAGTATKFFLVGRFKALEG
ncbi:MAG: hypothetical protein WC549_01870 [Actinomycetota bacterium]